MQNSSQSQMLMLLTRIGKNSKMIINGDLKQNKNNNGLEDIISKIKSKYPKNINRYQNKISLIELEIKDIQRNPIIEKIINLYE